MQQSSQGFKYVELMDDRSPSVDASGDDDTKCTMHIRVPWFDYDSGSVEGKILGYSYLGSPPALNADGSKRMQRKMPWAHPRKPWLWATKILQAQGVEAVGMTAGNNGDPYAVYTFVDLTIGFQSLPYTVLSDQDLMNVSSPAGVADESLRFVAKLTDARLETLNVPNGTLVYREMAPGMAWDNVTSPTYIKVMHKDLEWTWRNVSPLYLMLAGTDIPANLDKCVGKVNNNTWNGYLAGTLLMRPYKLDPVEAPVSPSTLGLPINGPPRMWNVKLYFDHFDPDPDPNIPGLHRGHLMVPAPQLTTAYWYYATSKVAGALGNVPIYQGADFRTIFQSPN